jgi:uncharacterized protein with von Willebrand factor type A (vWA) domain
MNPRTKHYSDLSKNILLFSQALREKKVRVTTDNVLDALRGTSFINIERKEDFYHLLKSNFISHRDEGVPFDELFEQVWSFEDRIGPSLKKSAEQKSKVSEETDSSGSSQLEKSRVSLFKERTDEGDGNQDAEEKEVPGYSPEEILSRKDFRHLDADELEKVREFVSALSRKMALTLSRRWKQGKAGDQLDFRRTLRQSLKYGGDLVELRMKEPKPRPLQLILVCDVSGSMDIYSQFFLLFMYGLQNHYPHCETFVYSTRLSHIRSLLKRKTFQETLRLLSERVVDWSGGTNIGAALHQLHQRHPDFFVSRRTLFLIFSDGWDRGDTLLLDSEMKNLKRQAKRLIWLNPLLGSRNYQPLCKGMATALPYLDHFLPCHNFASLKNLSHLISRI